MHHDLGLPLTVVLVLDHAFVSGGQAKVAFDSALGLKRFGHTPIVFAAAGPIDPSLVEAGIRVICLEQSDLVSNPSIAAAAFQGIWNKAAAATLDHLLAGLPHDRTVVHVHGWAKALSPSIAGPIARSGLRAIYTMHEYFLLCPNGGFYNYKQQATCHLQPLSTSCWATNCDSRNYVRKLWRNARQVVMTRVAKLPEVFDDVICISNFQQEAIGSKLPEGARIHLVSNPIATSDLGQKANPTEGDIVYVGRISPEKGTLLFAEACRRLGRVPVFVGDGPARAELMAQYPEAQVLGWQNHDTVRAMLRAARALVFPSLWYEGQPLVVLEAKSLGTPVIVSDGCAARDDIEDGISGLWFRNADADDLARVILAMSEDDTARRLSRGAYAAFWADPPTIEKHVRTLLGIYRAGMTGEGVVEATRAA